MVGRWKQLKLEDIATPNERAFAMGPFGSNIRKENYRESGVPIIRGTNLGDGRFSSQEFVYLTEDKADELKNSWAYPQDIVFVAQGTVGKVGIIPEDSQFDKYVLSQNLMKFTCDKSEACPLFLYYYFVSYLGQHEILSYVNPTGVPCISQPLTSLKKFEVPLPPLPEQKAIAMILGSLDDKVELNRRMNETLEQMARAIFKSWFVDFDPVRTKSEGRNPAGMSAEIAKLFPDSFADCELGKIPEGWDIKSLDQIATYLNGLALQKFPPDGKDDLPVIKIAQLRAGNTNGAGLANSKVPSEYVVNDGDVLFSWSGSLMIVIWCGGKGALNQHLFKVTSEKYPKWFYYLWTLEHLPEFQHIAAGKVTTMGHIQRHHLSEAKVVVPPDPLIKAMDSVMASFIEKIVENSIQSRTLASIRDALLPKLLSGEIRVKDAEKIVNCNL